MSPTQENKEKIRQRLIEKRQRLSRADQLQMSASIINHVENSSAFKSAEKIALYHAVRGEADPKALIQLPINKSKQYYLPILDKNKDKGLAFISFNSETKYIKNEFSIPEPLYFEDNIVEATDLDLVIMPLLGFDKQGTRLGMGGGYYDRSFSFKKDQNKKTIKKPLLMGFAYDFQECEMLIAEPWDIPLDMVATEGELIIF